MKPLALVVTAPGTNRDEEAAHALELAGAETRIVSETMLGNALDDAQLLVIPGGFSYGDALGSGRLFALELRHALGNRLAEFVASGRDRKSVV